MALEDDAVDDTEESSTSEDTEETGSEEGDESREASDEQEEGGEEQSEDEPPNPFDDLSADQLRAIKESPELTRVYKKLVGAATKKFQKAGEAMQLARAYENDPEGVMRAIALANGYRLVQGEQEQPQRQPSQQEDPGAELEALFGDKVGPQVRAVFEKWLESRAGGWIGSAVNPLQSALGQVMSQNQMARMGSAEQSFKSTHQITPRIEQKIIELGESGLVVPGQNTSPEEYLETLYKLVQQDEITRNGRNVSRNASTRLADRINANRRDREPTGFSNRSGVKKVSSIKPGMSISEALEIAAREDNMDE